MWKRKKKEAENKNLTGTRCPKCRELMELTDAGGRPMVSPNGLDASVDVPKAGPISLRCPACKHRELGRK